MTSPVLQGSGNSSNFIAGRDDVYVDSNIALTGSESNPESPTLHLTAEVSLNSAPVLNGGSVSFETINEDTDKTGISGMSVSSYLSLNGASAGNNNTLGIAITSIDNSNGYWEYTVGGTWWTLPQDGLDLSENSALLVSSDTNIRFIPSTNFNGTASIKFRAWDGNSGSSNTRADVTVNGGNTAFSSNVCSADAVVNAVNDPPSVIKNPNNSEVLYFDGTQNNNVSVNDMKLNDSFTAEAWVKIDAANNYSRIFDFGTYAGQGTGNNNIWLGFNSSNGNMEFEVCEWK